MIDIQAAIAGDTALMEAWAAHLSGLPMTWLPLEHFQ